MKSLACLCFIVSLLLTSNLLAEPSIPALHSFTIKQNTLVFEVTSYGCSQDKDFELQVEDNASITLIRNRADRCKRAPMVIIIKRSLKLLQEKHGASLQPPFAVRNPFTAPPGKHPVKKKTVYK